MDRNEVENTIALIVHTILFDGPVLFSDSNVINNPVLRHSLRSSEVLRDLVRERMLCVTLRSRKGHVQDLTETARKLAEEGGVAPGFAGQQDYTDFSDLEFFQQHGHLAEFDLGAAQSYYEETILRIFSDVEITSPTGEPLPEGIRATILELAQEELAEGRRLGALFFSRRSTLGAAVESRVGDMHFWDRWGEVLDHVANTPSMTFWADRADAVPIYRRQHQAAISLWRRMHLAPVRKLVTRRQLRVGRGPATYVAGLTALTAEDISALLQTDKARAWFDLIRRSPDRIALDEVFDRFAPYRLLVEDVISRRVLGHATEDARLEVTVESVQPTRLNRAGRCAAKGIAVTIADLLSAGIAGHLLNGFNVARTLLGKDPETHSRIQTEVETLRTVRRVQEVTELLATDRREADHGALSYEPGFTDGLGRDTLLDLS